MYKQIIKLLIFCLSFSLFGQYKQIDMGPTSYILCNDSTVSYYGINPLIPTKYSEKPNNLLGLDNVIMVTTGLYDGYFLMADSTVWGIDMQKFEFPYNISFFKMPDLKGIVKITSEKFGHTAIDANGEVWVWGVDKITKHRSTVTYKLNIHNVSEASYYNGGIVLKLNDGSVWQNYLDFADTSLKRVTAVYRPKHIYSDWNCVTCSVGRHNFAIDSNDCLISWSNYDNIPVTVDCNVKEAKLGNYTCQYLKNDGTVWSIYLSDINYSPKQFVFPQRIKNIFVKDDLLGAISEEGSIWQGKLSTDTIFQLGDYNQKYWTCANCQGIMADSTLPVFDTTINTNSNVIIHTVNKATYSYNWFPAAGLNNSHIPNPIVNISENTQYSVRVSDSTGCSFKQIFNLKVRRCDTIIDKYPVDILDSIVIPEKEITIKATGYAPYSWNTSNGITYVSGNEFTLSASVNSNFILTQQDTFNCAYSQDYNLQIRNCDEIVTEKYVNKLEISVPKDSLLELHPSTSYSTYSWYPPDILNIINDSTAVLNVQESGTILVDLYNSWNCPYTEIFKIKVLDNPEIIIPDIFTPNGDGTNDYFEIVNIPNHLSIQIFNIYNVLVFNSNNYLNNWDGRNNSGETLEEDNYWYIIKMPNSDIIYKGSVYIKR